MFFFFFFLYLFSVLKKKVLECLGKKVSAGSLFSANLIEQRKNRMVSFFIARVLFIYKNQDHLISSSWLGVRQEFDLFLQTSLTVIVNIPAKNCDVRLLSSCTIN